MSIIYEIEYCARWVQRGRLKLPAREWSNPVLVLGLILLLLGIFLKVSILYTIGIILLVIGAVLYILGAVGRPIGGRKHYW